MQMQSKSQTRQLWSDKRFALSHVYEIDVFTGQTPNHYWGPQPNGVPAVSDIIARELSKTDVVLIKSNMSIKVKRTWVGDRYKYSAHMIGILTFGKFAKPINDIGKVTRTYGWSGPFRIETDDCSGTFTSQISTAINRELNKPYTLLTNSDIKLNMSKIGSGWGFGSYGSLTFCTIEPYPAPSPSPSPSQVPEFGLGPFTFILIYVVALISLLWMDYLLNSRVIWTKS